MASENWFVGRGGSRSGPYSSAQLQQMAAGGQLAPTDLVWREGFPDWVTASSIKTLFPARLEPRPAPPPVNPYAEPAASGPSFDTSAEGLPLRYAEYLPRVGAYLLDGIFVGLMGCIPAFGIGFVFLALAGNDPDAQAAAQITAQLCSQIVGFGISLVYFVTLETSLKQGTWGKQIVGIKVTDLDGNRITAGRAMGRFFAKFLSALTCGVGYLMPLFTDRKQTLHDLVAGCLALKR